MLTSQTRVLRKGADFSTQEAFNSASTVVKSTDRKLPECGIVLDSLGNSEYAVSAEELHCFIVGETGSGKTRRIILPSIRLMAKTGQSMVLSDPKGELYRKTSAGLREKGYEVKVINMRSPRQGCRWNPFTLVEKLYNSGSEEDRDKALIMAEDIINLMKSSCASEKDPYWENAASQYIRGLILLMLEYAPRGCLTLQHLYEAETEMSRMLSGSDELLNLFLRSLPSDSHIKQNLSSVLSLQQVSTTLGCVCSVAETILGTYIRQSAIRHLLSDTDFDIEEIGRKSVALFIILPDDSDSLYPLATLLVSQIYSALVALADSLGGKLPNRVNFILEEFANFAVLNSIGSMLTASRSRGIRFILVCQNVGQLEGRYGTFGAETIRSNCRVWVFMGCRNLEFLQMLRSLSGIHIERYSGEQYPLIDVDMLQTLSPGEVFVWNDRCSPKLCHLPDISSYDFGNEECGESGLPPVMEGEEYMHFDLGAFLASLVDIEEIEETEEFEQEEGFIEF